MDVEASQLTIKQWGGGEEKLPLEGATAIGGRAWKILIGLTHALDGFDGLKETLSETP